MCSILLLGHVFKVLHDLLRHILVFLPFKRSDNLADEDVDAPREFRTIIAIFANFLRNGSH
jgi:hypothetical protein